MPLSLSQTVPVADPRTLALVRTRFVRAVYQWMAGGLVLTAASALLVVRSPALMGALVLNRGAFLFLILAELGLVVALSGWIGRMSVTAASWAFLGYSVLNGVTLSVIFLVYTGTSIVLTLGVAAATFGAAALYGTVTRRDLTSAGSFAFMGLVGVLVASIANWFLRSPALDWALSYMGVLVFTVLAAYDAQKVQRIGVAAAAGGEAALSRQAILGALALYLDFVNLFLFLLRIFGRGRD
ncbi:Bax inhibitor-1/YccA family protein [Deferrisoma camini]|uniref:Bax inhibitor-1/YccA family protein n=1 Tax=Deferrisoma camini TaxID=1035120 RepID=UPI0004BB1D80|nr:Bax inhibitor-1/YccA family protein [Deferrisoma camini]